MGDTHNDAVLAGALMDLVGFLNSPQRDDLILREAGVTLDRALFPLLVRLGALGPLGVGELADHAGRDHSTVSRQVAKLESLGLVSRRAAEHDHRVRAARITPAGEGAARAIAQARQRLFDRLFADWSSEDRAAVGRLTRRLADDMVRTADGDSLLNSPLDTQPAPVSKKRIK